MASDPVSKAIDGLTRAVQEQTREFKKMTEAIHSLKPKTITLSSYLSREEDDGSATGEASTVDDVQERSSD